MYYIDLIIGISIGLAIGVLLMILLQKENQDISLEDHLAIDDFQDQVHEVGFLEVPLHQLIKGKSLSSPFSKNSYKKRMEKFKNRNKFYR